VCDVYSAPHVSHCLNAENMQRQDAEPATFLVVDTTQITHPENRCHPHAGDPCHPLAAHGHAPTLVSTSSPRQVRRLTATECELLQGFPRNYTLVPYRGKLASDGPRYRAIGNSFAVPVVRWIAQRMQHVEEIIIGIVERSAP
jgi:DNA (cytosine-5)-methyltransferase 1